jgi:peptidase E
MITRRRSSRALEEVVASLDALWVVGGNAFVLRRALSQSGLDAVLTRRAGDSAFVYAGYSAGSCVMGSTLRGIELVDDYFINNRTPFIALRDGEAFISDQT